MKKMIFFFAGFLVLLTYLFPLFSESEDTPPHKKTPNLKKDASNDLPSGKIRKKIPLSVMTAFLEDKFKGRYQIIDGEDVLVPAGLTITFGLDIKNHKLFIKAARPHGNEELFRKFALKVMSSSHHAPDINSGSRLSLILRERSISVKLMGRALESGNIGDIIRVRAYELAKNFKVRLTDKNEGEILP